MSAFSAHPTDDLLELYAMSRLPEAELAPLEEHILVCPACSSRLEEMDAYVQAITQAAKKLEREPPPSSSHTRRFLVPRLASVVIPVFVVLAISFLFVINRKTDSTREQEITLLSSRGSDSALISHGLGHQSLRLKIDTRELADLPLYRIEIVDSNGTRLSESTGRPQDHVLEASVHTGLSPGHYWVRLYSGAPHGEILREFGLQID